MKILRHIIWTIKRGEVEGCGNCYRSFKKTEKQMIPYKKKYSHVSDLDEVPSFMVVCKDCFKKLSTEKIMQHCKAVLKKIALYQCNMRIIEELRSQLENAEHNIRILKSEYGIDTSNEKTTRDYCMEWKQEKIFGRRDYIWQEWPIKKQILRFFNFWTQLYCSNCGYNLQINNRCLCPKCGHHESDGLY